MVYRYEYLQYTINVPAYRFECVHGTVITLKSVSCYKYRVLYIFISVNHTLIISPQLLVLRMTIWPRVCLENLFSPMMSH
jgi:hypothetical protein